MLIQKHWYPICNDIGTLASWIQKIKNNNPDVHAAFDLFVGHLFFLPP